MRIVNVALDNSGNEIQLSDLRELYFKHNPPRSRWSFKNVQDNIKNLITINQNESNFKNYLITNFKDIVIGLPNELEAHIDHADLNYTNLLFKDGKQQPFGKLIEEAFDYRTFRSSTKGKWFARALNIKTCLYCNSQSTLQVDKKASFGLLFQFDHFYSKSKHPYLSLSLYNLVPSCANCNIAKSKTDFKISNAFHPYKEDISTHFQFKVNNPDVLNFLLNEGKGKVSITIEHKDLRVEKHVKLFSLEQIFNQHTDHVEELFLKAYYYNKSKQAELIDLFKGVIDTPTIMRFILGNYYLDDEINKRPLAKMIKDVAKQVKLI